VIGLKPEFWFGLVHRGDSGATGWRAQAWRWALSVHPSDPLDLVRPDVEICTWFRRREH